MLFRSPDRNIHANAHAVATVAVASGHVTAEPVARSEPVALGDRDANGGPNGNPGPTDTGADPAPDGRTQPAASGSIRGTLTGDD